MCLVFKKVLAILSFVFIVWAGGCVNIAPHSDSHLEHSAGTHSNHNHEKSSSTIHVHNQWIRAVPPVSHTSAAYMTLMNNGSIDDQLIGVATSISKVAEIHNVKKENGLMSMYPVEFVELPSRETVEIKPGGFHVMLIGLKKTLKVGEEVELMLHFKNTGKLKIKVPVREGMSMKHKMPMKHKMNINQ